MYHNGRSLLNLKVTWLKVKVTVTLFLILILAYGIKVLLFTIVIILIFPIIPVLELLIYGQWFQQVMFTIKEVIVWTTKINLR